MKTKTEPAATHIETDGSIWQRPVTPATAHTPTPSIKCFACGARMKVENARQSGGPIMSSPKKEWRIVAHETITHSWIVEAATEDEANEIALEGCPLPDGDCSSVHFDIMSVKQEVAL